MVIRRFPTSITSLGSPFAELREAEKESKHFMEDFGVKKVYFIGGNYPIHEPFSKS